MSRTSLIYKQAWLYELVMRVLYGRHYTARYRAIADLIPDNCSVLDVCCGPATLYSRYLRGKGLTYIGCDLSEAFVERLQRLGVRGEHRDLRDNSPLPAADYVVMQASLYQFLPEAEHVAGIVDRMLQAARQLVIIAEPIRNLTDSRWSFVARLSGQLTNAGHGPEKFRFTPATLEDFFRRYSACTRRAFDIPGGRERVYVLDAEAWRAGQAIPPPGQVNAMPADGG